MGNIGTFSLPAHGFERARRRPHEAKTLMPTRQCLRGCIRQFSVRASTDARLSSLDLSVAPPAAIASKIRDKHSGAAHPHVPCADNTPNFNNPALRAAQAKDAAFLAKVVEDVCASAGSNWSIEITSVQYIQALPSARPFSLDNDFLASLALARGASFS